VSAAKTRSLPHQSAGTQFLRSRDAAALFDEQGLGKTKQLIDALVQDVEAGVLDAALIVCPNTLKTTWGEEIEKHSTLRYAIFGAGKKARREAFRSLKASFYVINYEAVAAEMASLRALLRFKRIALVLDESHRIKTPSAKITKAVLSLRDDARKRYIMTGTPVANKPEDLWSQLFFLDDGARLGASFEHFRKRYGPSAGGYRSLEDLRSRLQSISLRREKEGTVKLPPKRVNRVAVALKGRQLAMYNKMRDELALWVQTLNGEEVQAHAENILTRLVRLAQLASNPGLIDASYKQTPAKFAALDQLLPKFENDRIGKAIVWTSFVRNIDALMERYEALGPVCLHGEMDGRARDKAVHAFKTDKAVRLMIANPAAAREGLTLTQARTAVYLDRTFNLVDFLQSQDRIHRLSQQHPCDVILLIAQDTVDEFVDYSLAQKHRLARYTQSDTDQIASSDVALTKPDVLRALISPPRN
jgi:SWI/SNF-related matrix-associated actin-dependent regulator of chromatin subfamily A-like protein 1